MPSVVFVCVANSFRSQMAEAIARSVASGEWEIWSAGSNPSGQVHGLAKQLMAERGIDLSTHRSKGVEALPARQWDYVVTMGCGDRCPTLRGRQRLDWNIPDPAGIPLEEARKIRDDLEQRVRTLMAAHHTGRVQ
jgi:protein-tyrosine-phosphatase